MDWINYAQIQEDLETLLRDANISNVENVQSEADERDYNFPNMPLIDIRLASSLPEVRAGRDYYVFATFNVQITVMDLSSFKDAATLRDQILQEAINVVRKNANFSAEIQTSRVGPVAFDSAKDTDKGAFMSAATFEVICEAFVDAT